MMQFAWNTSFLYSSMSSVAESQYYCSYTFLKSFPNDSSESKLMFIVLQSGNLLSLTVHFKFFK